MKKYSTSFALLLCLIINLNSQTAKAMSVNWSGLYRAELVEVDSTSLDSPKLRKSYLLNYLQLNPKIYAADGVNVVAQIDMLPNANAKYADAQMGQSWGAGVNSGTSTNASDSNVMTNSKRGTTPLVKQLYLNINQEFGSLLLGRAPLHFGLGIAHNAGNGEFDHYAEVQDLVAYKFIVDNVYFMPIIAKVYDGSLQQGSEATDQTFVVQYDNAETGSSIGVYQQRRSSQVTVNDAPTAALGGASITEGFSFQNINVYFGKLIGDYSFKLEAGFLSGSTGVIDANNEMIKMNSYGLAMEFEKTNKESKYWKLKLGVASGDDPNTKDFEGYAFHRNYDVGFLLFNHRLGQLDLLRTSLWGSSTATGQSLDDEFLSNTLYLAPQYVTDYSERVKLRHTLVWASMLQQPNLAGDVQKNLGLEYDFEVIYQANERVKWINELGLLAPGDAFRGGALDYGNNFSYGFTSKAAISF